MLLDTVVKLGIDVSVVMVAVPCTRTLVSCAGSIACIIVVFVCCEITLFGFSGLIGEIGLTGLFIFVAVILQVSNITDHAVHIGEPYGSEQIECLCSCEKPSKPAKQLNCLVSTDSIHVGGSGVQLLEVVVQAVQLCEEHSKVLL